MLADHPFGQSEPDAIAGALLIGLAATLEKTIEDMGEVVRLDAGAIIADLDDGMPIIDPGADVYRAITRRKFEGI